MLNMKENFSISTAYGLNSKNFMINSKLKKHRFFRNTSVLFVVGGPLKRLGTVLNGNFKIKVA